MKSSKKILCFMLVAVLALALSAVTAFAAPNDPVTEPFELEYDYTLEEPSETEVYGAFQTTMITRKLDTGVVAIQIPTNAKSGYSIYKLDAENGGSIESLKITLTGRITNPMPAGVLILTVSASNDNQNWTELDKKTCVDTTPDYSPLELNLPDNLTGKTTVYVKLAIELSADAPSFAHDWIHFTSVRFDGTQRYVPTPDDGITRYPVTFTKGDDAATGRDPEMDEQAAGATVTLPKNPYKKTGAEFVGWSDGTNTYAAGASYTMPASKVDFVAQWKNYEYKVNFAEGTDVYTGLAYTGTAPAAESLNYMDEYAFPENPFTCEGYEFAGWRVGYRLFAPGETLTMGTSDVTVYPYFVSKPNGKEIDLGAILDNDEFVFLIQGKDTDTLMSHLYDSYNMSGRASINNPEDPGYFATEWHTVYGEGARFDGYYYGWMTFCLNVGENKQFDDLLIRMNGRVANYGADYTEMNVYYSYDNETWELAQNTVGAFPENGLQSAYNFILADAARGHSKIYVRFEYLQEGTPDYADDWIGITALQFEGLTVDKTDAPDSTDPSDPDATEPNTDATQPTSGDNKPADEEGGMSPIIFVVIGVAVVAVAVVVFVIIKKKKSN